MYYNEWLADQNNSNIFNDFPKLKEYLNNKYYSYELKYSSENFKRQVESLLTIFSPVLNNIEKAFSLRNSVELNLDNLGDKQKITGDENVTITGINSENYVGYQVIGEFKKDNENRTDNKVNNQTIQNYNYLDVLNSLESKSYKLAWYDFEKQFKNLFILIYDVIL